jgi:hypothetical protein
MSGGYRPISRLGKPDPDLDTLHDDVMPWMVNPLLNWLAPFLWVRSSSRNGRNRESNPVFLDSLELTLRLREPLDRTYRSSAARDVEDRIRAGGTFGLDVAGYAVYSNGRALEANELNGILHAGGSAWEIVGTPVEGKRKRVYLLTRRELAPTLDAVKALENASERASRHLVSAWSKIAVRDPDPNGGYDQAVKAVEAAGQPIILPKSNKATLGTMIASMKAKPSKWSFALGDFDTVIAMSETLWTNHIRHGTDARTDHVLQEADAALHLAIPLVRYFAGGLITAKN